MIKFPKLPLWTLCPVTIFLWGALISLVTHHYNMAIVFGVMCFLTGVVIIVIHMMDDLKLRERQQDNRNNAPVLNGEKIKMYVIFAKESVDKMKGSRGKLGTQAGHGYLHAFWDASDRFPDMAQAYRDTTHAYKITLVVPTVADLEALEASYRDVCGVSLVKDAGFTVFAEPTVTVLGVGPLRESDIGDDIKALKTLQ